MSKMIRESKVIYDSLVPDNKNFPKNLEMDMQTNNLLIFIEIKMYIRY